MSASELINVARVPPNSDGCGPRQPAVKSGPPSTSQQIFEYIRANGRIPRVDVARGLEISAASVTTLTADLIDEGFVTELRAPRPPLDSGRGRPPVALAVNPEAGYVAGIKLADHSHTAVILDFAGNRIADAAFDSTTLQHTFAELLDLAEKVLHDALRQASMGIGDISYVGLGLPGIVDHSTGMVPCCSSTWADV